MKAFETTAIIEDASHLALRELLPHPAGGECRVVVLFDSEKAWGGRWPDGFFDAIRIEDEAFTRPPQV